MQAPMMMMMPMMYRGGMQNFVGGGTAKSKGKRKKGGKGSRGQDGKGGMMLQMCQPCNYDNAYV